jgi:hypothetical protein
VYCNTRMNVKQLRTKRNFRLAVSFISMAAGADPSRWAARATTSFGATLLPVRGRQTPLLAMTDSLGVTGTTAHALIASRDPFWRLDMISRQYNDRRTQRERTVLACCIQPYNPDEDEEALA